MAKSRFSKLFDATALAVTKTDVGGKAREQLSIAEARQALSSVLKVFASTLTLEEVSILMAHYVKK